METTKPRNASTADAPFNDPTDSVDLVIRTADNVDFFVLSVLLSLRSPSSFFRHVLQPNQHTEERDGLPVLEVKEDSDTFRTILLFCYPYASPEIKSVEQLVAVGKVLDKYCMDHTLERFIQTVIASSLIKEHAMGVFAHAVGNGWKELAEAAAKNMLTAPFDSEVELEDLRCIDALQYVRLRNYHRRCGKAAQALTPENHMPWLKGKTSDFLFLGSNDWCTLCGGYTTPWTIGDKTLYAHGWLNNYLVTVMAEVLGRPSSDIALDENIIAQAIANSISQCGANWAEVAGNQIHRFARLVAEEIDRRISQEPLNIDWAK
ncbi:uncharacterized protein BT62DRAFT_926107 [Guyanagaster necrorhizus]|uniref:BTB domain-containing protein n=1 Tax=Guyanagaster necrorhizus TaxID=856835 RepID=A0A9P7W3T4_9AGAR|nr:uncharacterized protein BT62DRAFT_926107 [Guyanagaster necrorhizus MCA 3950]KAG7451915.1 hypothetical protein BT62DRAFT_926107 [Guyanagaster necrorhizus MCA 3950]